MAMLMITASVGTEYQQSAGAKANALRYVHSVNMPMNYVISAVEYILASPSQRALRQKTQTLRTVECGGGRTSECAVTSVLS